MDKTIKGKECRFVVHIPTRDVDIPDYHLIKETIHYTDGTSEPNLRMIENYQRPYWVSKMNARSYTQKKEWEDLDKLLMKEVTQSNLYRDIGRILNQNYIKNPKELLASPYIYGVDIDSTTFIKREYQVKYPDIKTPYTVSTLDIETDVINGTKDIIMCTVTYKNEITTVVLKSFIEHIPDYESKLNQRIHKYIGDYIEKANLIIKTLVATDPVELIKLIFNKLHIWKPDILAIWNINYDIPEILRVLEKYHADPKIYLCDPSIPYNQRVCRYREGQTKKVTASGQVKPLNPALQWHTLDLTASFYVLDAMCVYRRLRIAKQEEPSYALNAILDKELGIRKLSFTETDQYSGLKWHQVMQSDYKLEYIVYNIFDAYSMCELENKTTDLSYAMPSLANNTSFSKFNSQPKLISDAFFFFLFNNNQKVLGCTGRSPVIKTAEENDEESDDEVENYETLGLKGWICTLPSFMSVPGLPLIEEDPLIATNARGYVSDVDASAAYPTATSINNVSKENTYRELCTIKGVPEDVFKLQNLNFITGKVNAIEYTTTMLNGFKLTDFDNMLL